MSKIESRLPKWVERRYEILWEAFKDQPFDLDQASEILSKKNKDKREEIPVFLSEIKKAGWLKAELDPKDSRKRNYTLISRKDIIEKVLDIESETIGRDEIERILKRAADLIRTRVDYKFILVLLFLKRVNDKWELEFDKAYKEAIDDGLSERDAKKEAASSAYHEFDLPGESTWESIRREVEELPEKFSKAMKVLAERNPELRDIFDNVDFLQFASNRENAEILRQLVELFSERRLHTVSADVLGDAYEWILRYFSPEKAKEGEVYTPREVIKVLVEITDPQPKESVYDPACASGGMLISSYKHVEENGSKKDADKLFLYGQEANPHTLALGRMNLYIHDIANHQLAPGDTLLRPKFKEGEDVKKFNVVLANPPWNQDGYDEEILKKGEFWQKRFGFGFTPAQSADWAWIQHMIASADIKTGRVGIVIDNGCLSRTGKEGSIRRQLVEKIECVILLPEKLFYNTPASGAILILRHKKSNPGHILFINAINKFQKNPDVRKLNQIGQEHIDDIVDVYKNFKNSKFSRLVSMDEIEKNDFNLNVTRYVNISKENEVVDTSKTIEEYKQLDNETPSIDIVLSNYLKGVTTTKFKQTEIGDIPEEWDVVKLGDSTYTEIIMGQSPPSSTYNHNSQGLPFLQGNADFGEVYPNPIIFTTNPIKKALKDDILISVRAPVGEVNLSPFECCIGRGLSAIRVNPKKLNYLYVFYYVKYSAIKLHALSSGSTFKAIKKSDLDNFIIIVPPLEEQQKVANILSKLDHKIEFENEKKRKLQKIKQGLMVDLLTGKKRLN